MLASPGFSTGPVITKKTMSPAQFDRGYEPLLKREGAYVYTKEETTVEGKFGKLIEQLLSTFSGIKPLL
jgi:hypothetical protein